MKKLMAALVGLLILTQCQNSEMVSDFTGNQATYGLTQASQYPVSGTVTFKERKDGTTTVVIQLKGTDGYSQLPAHLHLGDVTSNAADVAALLNPVNAKTGASETIIKQMADESKVSYKEMLKLAAYVNVHAAVTGPESSVVLVAGNIGVNGTKTSAANQIGVCKSN
jgi:hypothetical protein